MSRFNFNLDAPSGSLIRDLDSGKRVEVRRGQNTKVERVQADKRVIRFVCSTDGVKRDGNRLRNDGWDLESFSKNPVMLWSHDYSQPPVGSWRDWKVVKDGSESALVMTAKFADHDFADTVYNLYVDGHMRAVSIGWTPLEYEKLEDEDGNFVGFDFVKNELLECSAVPIPADPDALMQATARGLISGDQLERFALATRVGDISRGEAYVLDHRGIRQEDRVAIVINEKAVDWAKGAIEKGDYESSEDWAWSEEDAKFLLDGEEGEDWDGYSFHFLGRDEEAEEESFEGWTFPIAKRRDDGVIVLYASALELAIETAEDESIVAAATAALEELRARDEESDDSEEEEEEAVEGEEVVEEDPEVVVEADLARVDPADISMTYDSLVASIKGTNLPLMELWKSVKAHKSGEERAAEAVEADAHRVMSMLATALDLSAEMIEQVGGGAEGGGTGEGDDSSTDLEATASDPVEHSIDADMQRVLEALTGAGSWSAPDTAGAGGQGDKSSTGAAADAAPLSDDDMALIARALGQTTGSDWTEDGESRIGKKVSRKRTEKIADASRSVLGAHRMLEEVLEDIGGSELVTEEEVADDTGDESDVPADDSEDSRKARPAQKRQVKAKVKAKAEPASSESDRSLAQRIETLARSLDSESAEESQAKIDKALRSLAEKLDIDIDSNYLDEIL